MSKTTSQPTCSKCGTALKVATTAKAYFYGSPIRQCPKCQTPYLDRHYHEIEIDGIRESDLNGKQSLKLTLFCLVGLVICIAGWIFLKNAPGFFIRKLPTVFVAGTLFFGICFIAMLIDALKIFTGARKRQLEKERQASVKRLSDREYALKLQKAGYRVPEKYLQETT